MALLPPGVLLVVLLVVLVVLVLVLLVVPWVEPTESLLRLRLEARADGDEGEVTKLFEGVDLDRLWLRALRDKDVEDMEDVEDVEELDELDEPDELEAEDEDENGGGMFIFKEETDDEVLEFLSADFLDDVPMTLPCLSKVA